MIWLLTLAALLMPDASISGHDDPTNAATSPVVIPGNFLDDMDYPKEALRLRQEGRSVVLIHVDAKGRNKGCSIQQSSGSPSLDEATCKITRHLRFKPAKDINGKAVSGEVSIPTNWRLPSQ